MKILILLLFSISLSSYGQNPLQGFDEQDDLNVGSDIFSDFNEDLEATQVMEDERFYRYGRFFGVNVGLGLTTFTGNRGSAYRDNHPSFAFSYQYFVNFQNAVLIGIEYSQHTMFIDTFVNGSKSEIIGAVVTSMLRPFIGVRYYIDTSDLGTAITYSNPYFTGRVEYWYQTNTFPENDNFNDESGGGLGTGLGFGLEFPVELKKSYFNIEFLYHTVNFFDKFTQDYRQIPPDEVENGNVSEFGFDDLTGDVLTLFFQYNFSW